MPSPSWSCPTCRRLEPRRALLERRDKELRPRNPDLLLDVFTEDQKWLSWSRSRLTEALAQGPLVVNAVVLAEVSPRFSRIEDLEAAVTGRPLLTRDPRRVSTYLSGAQLISP